MLASALGRRAGALGYLRTSSLRPASSQAVADRGEHGRACPSSRQLELRRLIGESSDEQSSLAAGALDPASACPGVQSNSNQKAPVTLATGASGERTSTEGTRQNNAL